MVCLQFLQINCMLLLSLHSIELTWNSKIFVYVLFLLLLELCPSSGILRVCTHAYTSSLSTYSTRVVHTVQVMNLQLTIIIIQSP